MTMDCHTLVRDQVKLSRFKVIEWCQGSVDPAETWWHGLVLKEFIQQRPPLDSKGILRSLHEWLTSVVPYYHNYLWSFSTSSWSNEFSSQICKCETSRILFFFYIYFFQQSQACAGSIPEATLKSKISHSSIYMGFIGLCRNLSFGGRATRGSRLRLPRNEKRAESPSIFIWGECQKNRKDVVYEL